MNGRILAEYRAEEQEKDMLQDLLNWADVVIGDLENKGVVSPRDLEAFKRAVERYGEKPKWGYQAYTVLLQGVI